MAEGIGRADGVAERIVANVRDFAQIVGDRERFAQGGRLAEAAVGVVAERDGACADGIVAGRRDRQQVPFQFNAFDWIKSEILLNLFPKQSTECQARSALL